MLISLHKQVIIYDNIYKITDYIDNNNNIIRRKCHHCNKIKNIAEFIKCKMYQIDKISIHCIDCIKEFRHTYKIKKKYKITKEHYNKLLEKQDYKCVICDNIEVMKTKTTTWNLSVDHDHKTNKVRGLLCNACNNKVRDYENNNISHFTKDELYKIFNYLIKY